VAKVEVRWERRGGSGAPVVEHWCYDSDRSQHLVPKLGRRCGKHHAERQIHSTENEALRAMAYKEERASGFAAHQAYLRWLRSF